VPPARRTRTAGQLPPGRHGLARSFVATNQRARILAAVATVVTQRGYADTRVEDIIAVAGISRRTFYDQFANKPEAFLAAYDAHVAKLMARVLASYEANTSFGSRVHSCLHALLGFAASEPAFADMCVVEVLAAGPEAIERRNVAMKALGDLIQRAAGDLPATSTQVSALTAETIVGGIYEVMYARILRGQAAQLPALMPDLAYAVMVPYVGHEAAVTEMKQWRQRPATMD
jgi:AcrR family transcriptional regulator